ncbi:MAG: MBL fold metallo-hydrolase [Candidatus Shapirobacteria bacterium]
MLEYRTLVLGEMQTNCYLLWESEERKCFIIDPADEADYIVEEIQKNSLKPTGVFLTHGHFDHVMAALDMKLMFNVPIYCSKRDMFLLKRQNQTAGYFLNKNVATPNIENIDTDLDQIDEIHLGANTIKIIKTPGHTPGGVCFYCPKENLLFSGDTLFFALRGRTDFKYGSTEEIFKSIRKLMELSPETLVLSGHGQETTIENESKKYKFDRI